MSTLEQTIYEQMRTRPLADIIREQIAEAESALRAEQASLRKHAAEAAPTVRVAIERAADALEAACAAASEPVRAAVAQAVDRVLREHGVRSESGRQRPSAKGAGPDAALGILRGAGADGATTAEVARGCGVSVKVARRLCESLVAAGRASHNGKPRQESRYLASGTA